MQAVDRSEEVFALPCGIYSSLPQPVVVTLCAECFMGNLSLLKLFNHPDEYPFKFSHEKHCFKLKFKNTICQFVVRNSKCDKKKSTAVTAIF